MKALENFGFVSGMNTSTASRDYKGVGIRNFARSSMTRREALTAAAAAMPLAVQAATPPQIPKETIEAHDKAATYYMEKQITDPTHRWRGFIPTEDGLYYSGTGLGIAEVLGSAYLCPQSKYYKDKQVLSRIKLAMETVVREMTPDGNIWLPTTNFNSPPDTSFAMFTAGTTAANAKTYDAPELFEVMRPFLEHAKKGLLKGGVHTPNHRWMMCGALAALHRAMPDPALVRRAEQWLAESIDQDVDGQYTERSFGTYNTVVDKGLLVTAIKMNKPELFAYVRRNLDAMLYMMHADGEVITEISHRQDAFERFTIAGYWLPLAYLAVHDNNGQYARLANTFKASASLGWLLEYPELAKLSSITEKPLPEDYQKHFPVIGVTRIRHRAMSASVFEKIPLFFAIRKGEAVINGVRFASAFFGKGQFSSQTFQKTPEGWLLEQKLEGPYFQPFTPARKITVDDFDATRHERRQSEVSHLTQSVLITETPKSFRLHFRATGTRDVPVAIEVNFREGGELTGVTKLKQPDAYLLESGAATYTMGKDALRIGPGKSAHRYVEIRGALKKLSGPSLFITAVTPVDQVVEISWV